MSFETAVEFKNINFSYRKKNIFTNLNFTIPKGELLFMVGPNGGGKTTILKLILGLLTPDKGEILIFGHKPGKQSSDIGYVPQYTNFDRKFPISVIDVVLTGISSPHFLGPFTKNQKLKAMEALEKTDLSGEAKKSFFELSGGQQQRVLIARALASDPKLLLLDEPTSNIDAFAEKEFYKLIQKLHRNMTIINVTHDMDVINNNATSVLCVNKSLVLHPKEKLTSEDIKSIWNHDVAVLKHLDHECPISSNKSV